MKKPSLFSVIGTPISHSISPPMHNLAFKVLGLNAYYVPIDTEGKDLESVVNSMVDLGFSGWNITMPNKTEMAELCDELSEEAEIIGAVNTVENRDGYLIGHSTDGIGFFRNLKEHGFDPRGKRLLLLGAGGAARSIAAHALFEEISSLTVYNRTYEKAENLIETLQKKVSPVKLRAESFENREQLERDLEECDLLINATSVGMDSEDSLIPENWLRAPLTVAELIYKPRETELLRLARRNGLQTVGGLGMLLWQGAYAFKYWTGQEFPVDIIKEEVFKNSD